MAKSMADKVDYAEIMTDVTPEDLEALSGIVGHFAKIPNYVAHVFKNRGGRWKDVKVWKYVDLGTCRTTDLFMTDNNYKPIPIESTHILTYPKGTEREDIKLSQEINQEEENKVFTNEIKSDIIENVEDKEEVNVETNPEIINGDESNVTSNYSQF